MNLKLQAKCKKNGIELRIVDRWFLSSKTYQKRFKALRYKCDCDFIEDRDFNAALNLRDATTYEVA